MTNAEFIKRFETDSFSWRELKDIVKSRFNYVTEEFCYEWSNYKCYKYIFSVDNKLYALYYDKSTDCSYTDLYSASPGIFRYI